MIMADSTRITLEALASRKASGRNFSMLTCYDVAIARIMAEAGIEAVLVGDTAAEVVLGLPSTREIDPDFLLTLTQAVRRGAPNPFVMADLPYACRANGLESTVEWVRRFHDQTGSDAVKIEVTQDDLTLIERSASAGVPVVGHIGLLPQTLTPGTTYRAQGKQVDEARALLELARQVEDAGASMLLLEAVASEVAGEITERAGVPVIGCVSGPRCDGTVVVLHDLIGLGGGHPPRGVKQYADVGQTLASAFAAYVRDIQAGAYPTESDVAHMAPEAHEAFRKAVDGG
jgi:3-methyl-2-oxobutanoate hydroxymethyltransferase